MLNAVSLASRMVLGGCVLTLAIVPVSAYADDFDDDDDDDEGGGDFEDGDEDYVQPPVTAGGMYTKKTYPIEELKRPLTLTNGIFEGKLGLRIDMSEGVAFEGWRTELEGRYGIADHIELQAGFSASFTDVPEGGEAPEAFSIGAETAIIYDLVDFRASAEFIPRPDFVMDLVFGFPFRYKPKPQIALIALDKVMTIHTAGGKPDLTIGVGLVYQAHKQVALLIRGEVVLPQFEPDLVAIPAAAAVQFSANNLFDLGLEFRLGNLKAENPFDARYVALYGQFRL